MSGVKPEFLTNDPDRDTDTVASQLGAYLAWLLRNRADGFELAIATAYINPGGFNLLAEQLEGIENARLLLGVEPDSRVQKLRPLTDIGDPAVAGLHRALEGHYESLVADRDLLGFAYEADELAKRMVRWLRSGKVQVRRFTQGFLHGKAYLVSTDAEGVIAGSSNFTGAGLARNHELNLGVYQPQVVKDVTTWFDDLWTRAEDFDLAALYEARYREHPPWLIYLKMLHERYGEEVAEEAADFGHAIHLTAFQEDGVFRARKILEEYHGVLIADGVGLGKSFIAGTLMREARLEKRQRVLLIAPATLRDGMWRAFQQQQAEYQFDCFSYEQIAQDELLSDEGSGQHLRKSDLAEYGLVVIDEAHAYRNPGTTRAAALRKLLEGRPPKKLVLLTATPVNNTLLDLYYLLGYFVRNDARFADQGIRSLHEHFKQVAALSANDLSPKLLFDVLDAVAVRRTRRFVKKYYPTESITIDGEPVPIVFPTPQAHKLSYDLNEVLPEIFDDIEFVLDAEPRDPDTFRMPHDDIGKRLTLARYMPSAYLKTPNPEQSQIQVTALLLSGLLKRFESSVYAFANTCRRMAQSQDAALDALARGLVLTGDGLAQWADTASDDVDELLADLSDKEYDAGLYDVDELREAMEADRVLLLQLAERVEQVTRANDPKLAALGDALVAIADESEQEVGSDAHKRNCRKVLVFSFFADTVDWVTEYLEERVRHDPRLSNYQDRLIAVSGRTGSQETAVFGFAPDTSEPPGHAEDKYDIVVTTDVLAEGVNLQQARHIINYDLPWNPMRLVQRHGRIDRIGSKHDRVHMRCFFPDIDLDRLLGLEERLHLKLVRASAAVGVEAEVIPGSDPSAQVFSETREEIERLRRGDAQLYETGGEPTALSGEEYRQDLRSGLESSELARQLQELPWGAGSGQSIVGADPGVVFCARVGDHAQPVFRFVHYGGQDGPEVIADTLACLSRAACDEQTPRVLTETAHRRAYDAWRIAKAHILEEWMKATDPAALQPRVPRAMRQAAALLRDHPPPGVNEQELTHLLNSVEGTFGVRDQKAIRDAMRSNEEPRRQAEAVAQKIKDLGLEPSPAPQPLPPIQPDDIHLVCWMTVEPADQEAQ